MADFILWILMRQLGALPLFSASSIPLVIFGVFLSVIEYWMKHDLPSNRKSFPWPICPESCISDLISLNMCTDLSRRRVEETG